MRNGLKDLESNQRYTFVGKFTRLGYAEEYNDEDGYYYQPTILFLDVHDDQGHFITDHAWVHYTEPFVQLNELKDGDLVGFSAQVRAYKKGAGINKVTDYELIEIQDVVRKNNVDAQRAGVPSENKPLVGYVMERNRAFYEKAQRNIDEEYAQAYDQWLHPDDYSNATSYSDDGDDDQSGLDPELLAKLKQFSDDNLK
ncbi:hypothetical protein MOO44_00410 (plasmid) [Nicoliella spurrieriana]|uniref:Uncharacterized protein n=1 Tax=Nicoliella spurrieriana TaxID=2925830 RepID=A0A976RQZ2_9LACO|nr:hypothetical protein [Nicoliella spurrieriana]UQS86140.1 hypothetical protein MOO44_00410 [Nicoliella spurrieriana]